MPTRRTLIRRAWPSLAALALLATLGTANQYPAFKASGTGHAAGVVPDPGATAGTTRYLREDGTWTAPPGVYLTPKVVTFTTTSGTTAVTLAPTTYHTIVLLNVTANAATVTLPLSTAAPGYIFYVKKTDTSGNAVNIKTQAASGGTYEMIEGASQSYSQSSSNRIAFILTNDGAGNWWVN